MDVTQLQKEALKAKNNKAIKKIQKRINKLVNPRIKDISEILDYDTIKELPWINKNRPPKTWKKSFKLSKEKMDFMRKRTKDLLESKYIEEIDFKEVKCLIPWFTVGKKNANDKYREILDFSILNTYLKNVSANVPSYQELYELSKRDTKYAGIDLTKAYNRIILGEKIRRYMCYEIDGKYYSFKRMPFGLNIAPAIYQLFISRIISKIDSASNYLDDIKISGKNKIKVENDVGEVIRLLEKNNILINYKKSQLEAKDELEFLGYIWRNGKIYNKKNKIQKVLDILKRNIIKNKMTKITLSRLMGNLQFISTKLDSLESIKYLYKRIGNLKTYKDKNQKIKFDNKDIKKVKKLLEEFETKEITKYRKIEVIKRIKKLNSKETEKIYVDSSPYATGIFCGNTHKLYKIEFPKEIQRYTAAAAIKEQIGYILTSKLIKKKLIKCNSNNMIIGDNQGIIKCMSTGKTRYWKRLSRDIDISWVDNKNTHLDIADIVSREKSNNLLNLEKSLEYKILDKRLIKVFRSRKIGTKLEIVNTGIKLEIENVLNTLVPMKGIEWLTKDNYNKGRKIWIKDKIKKVISTAGL